MATESIFNRIYKWIKEKLRANNSESKGNNSVDAQLSDAGLKIQPNPEEAKKMNQDLAPIISDHKKRKQTIQGITNRAAEAGYFDKKPQKDSGFVDRVNQKNNVAIRDHRSH